MSPDTLVAGLTVAAAMGLGFAAPMVVRTFAPEASFGIAVSVPLALLIALWAWSVVPSTFVLPCTVVLGWTLLVLSTIDAWVFRLPDALVYPLLAAGLAITANAGWLDHAIGAVAGFLVLAAIAWGHARITGREGLGLGDAKLMAAAGAWLGWMALPSVMLLAALGGLLTYLVAALRRGRAVWSEPIPFGIPLCFSIWLTWLYGAMF